VANGHVNTEVFGDVFVQAVAAHCPKLTRFVSDAMSFHGLYCVTSFTDRSMRALATLPDLASITMEGGRDYTGNGLFDVVVKHAASTTQARPEPPGMSRAAGLEQCPPRAPPA
jgi:hypothetical protein